MKLKIDHQIESLYLDPGDGITLYLKNDNNDQAVQVEIRVLNNGTPQIFLQEKYLDIVYDFKDWLPLTS